MSSVAPVSDLAGMLAGMAPVLDARRWDFALLEGDAPSDAFAVIREVEGTTVIVAQAAGGFARITLTVHSARDGVGLTAAVAGGLAAAGIACNIVAGYYHDHLFVPKERQDEALAILQRLACAA